MTWFARLLADESGGALVEYALVSATLSVLMIGAITLIAAQCSTELGNTGSHLTGLGSSPP